MAENIKQIKIGSTVYDIQTTIANVENLQTTLDGKANSSHNHSALDITSGILPIAQGGTGNANGYVRAGQKSGTTIGAAATAEGLNTTASGNKSHAEGNNTTASGINSHAEGNGTVASAANSHAEGSGTVASGGRSHAEGRDTIASGSNSHAEGYGTIASADGSHAQGIYNIEDTDKKYVHIVGNGDDEEGCSNAHTLDWSGNAWFAGDVYVGSTSGIDKDAGSKKLATEEFVLNNINNGIVLTEGVDYGDELPAEAPKGKIFFVRA